MLATSPVPLQMAVSSTAVRPCNLRRAVLPKRISSAISHCTGTACDVASTLRKEKPENPLNKMRPWISLVVRTFSPGSPTVTLCGLVLSRVPTNESSIREQRGYLSLESMIRALMLSLCYLGLVSGLIVGRIWGSQNHIYIVCTERH